MAVKKINDGYAVRRCGPAAVTCAAPRSITSPDVEAELAKLDSTARRPLRPQASGLRGLLTRC